MTGEEMQDVGSAPSLASAMPAGLLRRLDRRKSRISKRDSGEFEALQPSTPVKAVPAGKENGHCTTPQRVGTPAALGTPGGTPSRCVVEVERMRQRREEKRMLHDRVRADLATCDEQHAFGLMILAWRQENEARLLPAVPLVGVALRPLDATRLSVCVRKRPLLPGESAEGDLDVVSMLGSRGVVLHETRRRVDLTRTLDNHEFDLDECFCEADSNQTIYARACRPLVHAAFDGRHSTVFAYGQTGSGKTFTMMGGEGEAVAGLYALAAGECFAILECEAFRDLAVSCSFYEIYREAAFDLMPVVSPRATSDHPARAAEDGGASGHLPLGGGAGAPVKLPVLEDANGEVQLVGLCEHDVEDTAEVLRLLREAQAARRTGNNSVHQRSSRSHALMQLFLRDRASGALHGKLTLVDLAGSERAADTLDASRQSRTEGADINRSLLCLKECIRALDMGSSHVPFRGSKLTHILRDSFTAADSRTAMLVHLSPAARATEQSLNSLRYAERLKAATARMAPQGAAAPPVSRTPSRARRVSCLLPQERVDAAEPCGPLAAHPPAVRVACDDGGAGPVEEGVADEGRCREMLLTVVDCLYDPDAWAEERGRLVLEGTGSVADLAAHGERLDLLLAERIELLEALRAKIGAWRR